jgi:hypothetical protein
MSDKADTDVTLGLLCSAIMSGTHMLFHTHVFDCSWALDGSRLLIMLWSVLPFSGYYASRRTFIEVANKEEQGIIKVLVLFLNCSQQPPPPPDHPTIFDQGPRELLHIASPVVSEWLHA